MVIRELTSQESFDLVARIHLARLACARDNQPYIIPIFFAPHHRELFCASTVGQKIHWMRENPLVAVEVDEITSPQEWQTVVISGRYEEFGNTPQATEHRELAWSLLQKRQIWWEPAYVETILGGTERPMVPLFFRVHIDRISGHRAAKE